MNGQMRKYNESLINTPGPIPYSQVPKMQIDMDGIIKYAKEKGMKVSELSEHEKSMFIKE